MSGGSGTRRGNEDGALSLWERVAQQRRVRVIVLLQNVHPHPALRATFSQREKDSHPNSLLKNDE
jgi:hypothetical protein